MLEVQLNKSVGAVRLKVETAIGLGLRQGRDQALDGQVAVDEEGFNGGANIQLHQVSVAEDLAVSGADDVFSMAAILVRNAGQCGGSGHGE